MDPKRKRVIAATISFTCLSTALAIGVGYGIFESLGLQTVQGAHWYEDGGHASVLVSGNRYESPDTGSSYYRFGFTAVDADTGERTGNSWYADSDGFPVGDTAPKVLGVVGHRVVYLGERGIEMRERATSTGHPLAELASRFPAIARPWFSSQFVRPGSLLVESDDRRKYRIDLATLRATDVTDAPPDYSPPSCNGLDWPQPDGTVWTFVASPPARHSDPNGYALASAHRIEYGQLRDVTNLELRVPFAMIPCDGDTGHVASFPDGSVLITLWSGGGQSRIGFAKLGRDQRIAWRWMSDVEHDANLLTRVFSHRGGFIVVVGSEVVSLDGNGRVRWKTSI